MTGKRGLHGPPFFAPVAYTSPVAVTPAIPALGVSPNDTPMRSSELLLGASALPSPQMMAARFRHNDPASAGTLPLVIAAQGREGAVEVAVDCDCPSRLTFLCYRTPT